MLSTEPLISDSHLTPGLARGARLGCELHAPSRSASGTAGRPQHLRDPSSRATTSSRTLVDRLNPSSGPLAVVSRVHPSSDSPRARGVRKAAETQGGVVFADDKILRLDMGAFMPARSSGLGGCSAGLLPRPCATNVWSPPVLGLCLPVLVFVFGFSCRRAAEGRPQQRALFFGLPRPPAGARAQLGRSLLLRALAGVGGSVARSPYAGTAGVGSSASVCPNRWVNGKYVPRCVPFRSILVDHVSRRRCRNLHRHHV